MRNPPRPLLGRPRSFSAPSIPFTHEEMGKLHAAPPHHPLEVRQEAGMGSWPG